MSGIPEDPDDAKLLFCFLRHFERLLEVQARPVHQPVEDEWIFDVTRSGFKLFVFAESETRRVINSRHGKVATLRVEVYPVDMINQLSAAGSTTRSTDSAIASLFPDRTSATFYSDRTVATAELMASWHVTKMTYTDKTFEITEYLAGHFRLPTLLDLFLGDAWPLKP